ncbi:molybdopterin-guanine dinucleotide biosynthesis protein B [Bacillus aquiflavi]|uniref:Molybdopterin-guanine dinucleotide biosynthesis protein B n=2 Tax=Bacillus aquiflavi TaxID=2672567 RepID=A0A7W1X2J4_9BACI|nr:molybdopterin-guanine dinucleotide biosynthesis protein B [Bacillus aquiflavi]MBA4536480.1 molybdopterin-guanine dinucleotide biosynthesis protein B [Bacillus aquiflavi]
MAVVKNPFILQIVGYQNSGKTTSILKIIERLTAESIHVVTIKHHAHGSGKPHVVKKDSTRHVDAGAIASLIEGNGRLLFQADKEQWTLAEQIELCCFLKPKLILIEGHKKANFPKIVLLRDRQDFHLLEQLTNIFAILVWEDTPEKSGDILLFSIKEDNWLDWAIQMIKNRIHL